MRIGDITRNALSGLKTAKLRSALTILGISIGIFAMVLLYAVVQSIVEYTIGLLESEETLRIVTVQQKARLTEELGAWRGMAPEEVEKYNERIGYLTPAMVEKIAATKGVAAADPDIRLQGRLFVGPFAENRDQVRRVIMVLDGDRVRAPTPLERGETENSPSEAGAADRPDDEGVALPAESGALGGGDDGTSAAKRPRFAKVIGLFTYPQDLKELREDRLVAGRLPRAAYDNEILLSADQVRALGWKSDEALEREITLIVADLAAQMTVVGVHKPASKQSLLSLMRFDPLNMLVSREQAALVYENANHEAKMQLQFLFNAPGDVPLYMSLQVLTESARISTVDAVRKEIEREGFETGTWTDAFEQFRTVGEYVGYAVAVLTSIGLVVAFFGVLNTLLMAVMQRTREIGVMMAVGAKPWDVRWQFIFEGAFLGLLGAAWGLLWAYLIGWGMVAIVRQMNEFFVETKLGFFIPWEAVFMALGLGVVVSVIAAILPAFRATRIDPVAALRHE